MQIGETAKIAWPDGITFPAEVVALRPEGTLIARTIVDGDSDRCLWHVSAPTNGFTMPVRG
jgi:hypothetical protein